jgi:hypothetical protein
LYQDLLRDASFLELLRRMDVDLAEETRLAGCPCGGVLHFARYRRKPRGGPENLPRECSVRESFCCSQDGCRRRSTPPSVLFLGRRVFFGLVVVLVPILREGLTPRRFRRLEKQLAVSRRTVRRWQRWWRESLPSTRFWRGARAELALGTSEASLPGSLLMAFSGVGEGRDRLYAVLMWLSDLGLSPGPGGHAR